MKTIDLTGIVHPDPEIMGGTPVFVGTRVPSLTLFDVARFRISAPKGRP